MEALIDKSLDDGALGVKLLGGHYPLKPDVSSLLIKTALERRAYVAWHAGTSEHGSNIEGMQEAVAMGSIFCRRTPTSSVKATFRLRTARV